MRIFHKLFVAEVLCFLADTRLLIKNAYMRMHAQARTRIRAGIHAYTCGYVRVHVRARTRAYAPWGEIRRTSRCDTPYHYPRHAVSLLGPPAGSFTNAPKKSPFRDALQENFEEILRISGVPDGTIATSQEFASRLAEPWPHHSHHFRQGPSQRFPVYRQEQSR